MFANILRPRKTLRGSWIGPAPYQSAPVHAMESAFSVKLENGIMTIMRLI